VKEEYRQRGLAKDLVNHLVEKAKSTGVRTLWYATSSRNEASQRVALALGFREADKVGYFRMYKPYPPHQKPSLTYIPLSVDAGRLHELLLQNPDLIESTTIPAAWEFEFKSRVGIERLSKKTEFRVIVSDEGIAHALYFRINRQRKDETTAAFTIFATDRSLFVDVLARTIDEAVSINADRAVYFLGPRSTEWALATGFVGEEFIGRQFLLYEINPIAEAE
jgi:predicted GNAT family acetyltransferase